MSLIFAIGDVHGCDGLLAEMHDRILDHARAFGANNATVVHIGDYVDRGRQNIAVIDRLMLGLPSVECICLKGNHEAMMLDCLGTDSSSVWTRWIRNGGDMTLHDLGYALDAHGFSPDALRTALGPERIAWLENLPLSHHASGYFFAHAGVKPGLPLDQQRDKDLMWIRYEFLESDADHGAIVVHGHTPTEHPVLRPNRIGIDTGAVMGGVLTAVILDPGTAPRFLTVG
ncbi:MAG: metallophosphoesterase family protein [Pseudomonadota bacterium]